MPSLSGRFHAFLNLAQYCYITHFCHYHRQLITALYPCGHGVIMGALYIDHYPSHMMPKLWCGVDYKKIAAAAITVNTSTGSGDSGPPTAPFDSAWKIGLLVTMLWVYNMIIWRRYWCIGREHHGVGMGLFARYTRLFLRACIRAFSDPFSEKPIRRCRFETMAWPVGTVNFRRQY